MMAVDAHEEEDEESSCLATEQYDWKTSRSYQAQVFASTSAKFEAISEVLLCQPQLNSTHLFRADIIYDSLGILQTPAEKETTAGVITNEWTSNMKSSAIPDKQHWISLLSSATISSLDLRLTRIVVRRLIPRKPKVDKVLEQTCFMYCGDDEGENSQQRLVLYRPHVDRSSEMPWYHPSVKALAFLHTYKSSQASLSVHFLPFGSSDAGTAPDRVHRTMLSLLKTILRLMKHDNSVSMQKSLKQLQEVELNDASVSDLHTAIGNVSLSPSSLKDTIIPQHLVQNTYTRLKEVYASDLISRWVEATEPSKHVFEDLSIAAFLIELWKQMYPIPKSFPGFVDIACGNGVLVYILLMEGYSGSGFDARRRKTWDILNIDDSLAENICIPQPFLEALTPTAETIMQCANVHNGIFPPSTFIISNHADELTPWTPLLARLSSASTPNPFLAIPCCSHALSGARHRYSAKDFIQTAVTNPDTEQPQQGDLKALRAKKGHTGDDKSMYGCLTRKVAALAQEVGSSVELTLMRIPSTRNIGIVGNRRPLEDQEGLRSSVEEIIKRECKITGGIEAAASMWTERAKALQVGKGRGKVNERRHEQNMG